MSDTKHTLDNLLALAKQQAPLLTREQVHEFVYKAPVKAFPGKQLVNLLKNKLNLIIMSTIVSSIIIGSAIWLSSHATLKADNPVEKDETKNPKRTITKVSEAQNKSVVLAKQNFKPNQCINADSQPITLIKTGGLKDSLPNMQEYPPIPTKKVIVKKTQLIKLSLDDFKKIGFAFTDTSYYYKNLSKDSVWTYIIRKAIIQKYKKAESGYYIKPAIELVRMEKFTNNDFQPWYISGYGKVAYEMKIQNHKHVETDSLIPIAMDLERISKSNINDTLKATYIQLFDKRVFWFNLTPHLYSLLPDSVRNSALGLYNLGLSKTFSTTESDANNHINENSVSGSNEKNNNISSSISNALVLTKDELTRLCFVFKEKSVEYRFLFPKSDAYIQYYYESGGFCKNGIFHTFELGKEVDTLIKFNQFSYYPEIVTDNKGKSSCSWGIQTTIKRGNEYDSITKQLGGYYIKLHEMANYLIPVLIKIYPDQPAEKDLYFWFTPTEEFFAALPKPIADVLKPEYDDIVKSGGTSSQSCTYFEVCKSTLMFNRLDIYPNPARQRINIEFNAAEELTGNISLIDIKGSELKVLQSTTRFVKGENKFSADLSGVNPGIYLIYFNTNKGFRTHRIVVTK